MSHAQLKAFHAVALAGSFSKAALASGLTQPALSDHVRKLEEAHGVELFLRHARGVSLTDLGRSLLARTERLFEAEGEIAELLTRARGLREGSLNIGADAAVHVLPLIARFRKLYPAIEIRITSGNTQSLLAELSSFQIDFAVLAELPREPALKTRALSQSPLIGFAAKNSAHARAKSLRFADLASGPLVLREKGSLTRRLVEEEFIRRKLRPQDVMEVEGREAAAEAVARGLGLGIVSQAEFRKTPDLVALPFKDWQAEMREWLVCLEARSELQLMRALFDLP